jgi:hypothetical protein
MNYIDGTAAEEAMNRSSTISQSQDSHDSPPSADALTKKQHSGDSTSKGGQQTNNSSLAEADWDPFFESADD